MYHGYETGMVYCEFIVNWDVKNKKKGFNDFSNIAHPTQASSGYQWPDLPLLATWL